VAWAWLAARVALFGVVLFVLWGPLRDASEDGHPLRAETYFRHAAILTVLLALYPFVQLLSPPLAGVVTADIARLLHALLDLATLGGLPLYVVLDDKRLAEIETQDRPFPPVIPRTARGTS
jgi:bacteriorhodopsin